VEAANPFRLPGFTQEVVGWLPHRETLPAVRSGRARPPPSLDWHATLCSSTAPPTGRKEDSAMKTVTIRNRDMYWDIAADIRFPPGFDEGKKYPTIISAHPIGSCKEQTSGNVYGEALAKAGFVVIAFDASFRGASGGEPRFIEDPTLRV